MKKKAYCIFALIAWLLTACTFLSLYVERQMVAQVTTVAAKVREGDSFSRIPLDALYETENTPCVFSVSEGTGWESGVRAKAVADIWVEGDHVGTNLSGETVVRYTSRPLKDGDALNIVRRAEKIDDVWLAVYPGGVPELGELSSGAAIEAQTGTALLVSVKRAEQPFMEGRAKSMIPAAEQEAAVGQRFYSLSDVEAFSGQALLLAVLLAMLVLPVILWAYCCFLSKNPKRNRGPLLVNAGIAVVLLAAVPLLLSCIDLPSSLLPQNSIVDFGHYAREFSQIFGALEAFAAEGDQTALSALSHINTMLLLSVVIFAVGGIVLSAVVILIERAFLRRRGKREGPPEKWR